MFLSLGLPGYGRLCRLGPEVVIDSLQETTRREVGGLLQKDGELPFREKWFGQILTIVSENRRHERKWSLIYL